MKVAVVPNLTKEAAQACTNEVLEILAGCGCETVLKTDLFTSHGTYQEKVEDSLLSVSYTHLWVAGGILSTKRPLAAPPTCPGECTAIILLLW